MAKKRKKISEITVTEFMTGRYGYDELSKLLVIISMVLMAGTLLIQSKLGMWGLSKIMYIIALLFLGFGYYRMASKNIKRRTTAEEWNRVLLSLALKEPNSNLATCSKNKKHIYPVHNANCPWCGATTIHDSGFMKGIRGFLGY